MRKRVEIFTAGCTLCNPVVELIRSNSSENCDVMVYDLIKQCDSKECLSKVVEYGVKSIPAIVVDGKLLDSCQNSGISIMDLINSGIIKNQ